LIAFDGMRGMAKFALWVELDVKTDLIESFLVAARADAHGSVDTESGCRRFDILQDPLRLGHVCFYEVYDDEAAWLAHRETAHFKRFQQQSATMVDARRVTRLVAEVGGEP
jgi:(4S)-4-hydroxy-5-phosphonooxypentane-2,3-dione isomerase